MTPSFALALTSKLSKFDKAIQKTAMGKPPLNPLKGLKGNGLKGNGPCRGLIALFFGKTDPVVSLIGKNPAAVGIVLVKVTVLLVVVNTVDVDVSVSIIVVEIVDVNVVEKLIITVVKLVVVVERKDLVMIVVNGGGVCVVVDLVVISTTTWGWRTVIDRTTVGTLAKEDAPNRVKHCVFVIVLVNE